MKKAIKYLLGIALVLFVSVTMFQSEVQAAEIVESGTDADLTWSIDSNGHLLIEGTGDYENTLWGTPAWRGKDFVTAEVKVSGMENMYHFFYREKNLKSVDFTGSDLSQVTNMEQVFCGCENLETVNFGDSLISNVTDVSGIFASCEKLVSVDLSKFDTSNVTDMGGMFEDCSSLESIDVSSFNTSNVTNMGTMFCGCESLTDIDVSNLDTSNVTNMCMMFSGCKSLTKLDLSNFNTSKVKDMTAMFDWCTELKTIDLSSFDTSRVVEMGGMFGECHALEELDLSNFNTSKVDYAHNMFWGCRSLKTIDLSNFDFSSLEKDIWCMFEECEKLTTIYTPVNVPVDIYLQEGKAWTDELGNVYTLLPKDMSESIKISAESHTVCIWGTPVVTKKATFNAAGELTYTCKECGKTKTSTIAKLKSTALSATKFVYNGKVRKPTITVKNNAGTKVSNTYYTVSYSPAGCKNVGTYKVTIKFKGRYSGSVTKTYQIIPKGTTISSLTKGSKNFTVKWKKQATQTTGYQVQYAKNKSFTNAKLKTYSGTKIVSKKVTGLAAKTKYFVRVRTYKTVNGKKIYSNWSGYKTVTTK